MKKQLAKFALTATLGLAITFTFTACDKESKTPAKIVGGTYSFGGDGNGSGSLMVYPLDEHSALFYLSLSRGAPSYNSGELSDKMTIKDNAVIYDYYSDEYSNCKLKFEFSQDSVKITTDEKRNECGFGFDVVADNTYKLINKAIPEYYINSQDDTIRFNKTTATAKPETAPPIPAGTGLCVADENVLISFKMEKSSKILSVCAAKDESYVVYRFGAQDNIEFEFPENKTGSWDKFTVKYGQQRITDMYFLEFTNNKYKYNVYHHLWLDGETVTGGNYGVGITNTSTGKYTDINGAADSIIGGLDKLYKSKEHKKLKTIDIGEIKPDDDD
jgi:hypothetical protein